MNGPAREVVEGWVTKLVGALIVFVGVQTVRSSPYLSGIWIWFFAITGLCFVWLGVRVFRHGRKLSQATGEEVLQEDPRSPILLLRSFRMDETKMQRPSRIWGAGRISFTFEEALVKTFRPVGPVITIGRPGDAFRPLGAARMYVSNEEWPTRVLELAAKSSHLVFILDTTPGLQWELEHVMSPFGDRNMVLVFPPLLTDADFERLRELLVRIGIDVAVDRSFVAVLFDGQGNKIKFVSQFDSPKKRLALLAQYFEPAYRAQLQDSCCPKCSVTFRETVSNATVCGNEDVSCRHEFTINDKWDLGPDRAWHRALRVLMYASTLAVLMFMMKSNVLDSHNMDYSYSYSFEPDYGSISVEEHSCKDDCGGDNFESLLDRYREVRQTNSHGHTLEPWEEDPSNMPVPSDMYSKEWWKYMEAMEIFKSVAHSDPIQYALLRGLIEGQVRYKKYLQWQLDTVTLGVAAAICGAALWYALFLRIYKIMVTLSYEPPEPVKRRNLAEITSREG